MMLELHNVTVGQLIRQLSLTVADGTLATLGGAPGAGKTTLLRAVLGFLPVDGGHISIDGELLTPRSAPYFRRQTAYVPQHLSVPEGYDAVPTDYVELLRRAVDGGRPLLIVDEPSQPLDDAARATVEGLLRDAAARGTTVLAVHADITGNHVTL